MITAASFPTPHLAMRTTEPAELARVHQFGAVQAHAAEKFRVMVLGTLPKMPVGERVDVLHRVHSEIVLWRYELARQAPGRLGQGIPLDAQRFQTTLRAGGPNYDRLGVCGRLRVGSTWDGDSRTYVGGAATPASLIMEEYGLRALARFASEEWLPNPDVLLDVADLPDAVVLPSRPRYVPGNQLVRGDAAKRIAADLASRIAARGHDVSQVETGGDPIYLVTARPDDADILFGAAMRLLARAVDLDRPERLRAWQDARYLLYQAPRTKKGSDAVTRVFLVAVGAVLFGKAPILEQDVDLRCAVLGQAEAVVMPSDDGLIEV